MRSPSRCAPERYTDTHFRIPFGGKKYRVTRSIPKQTDKVSNFDVTQKEVLSVNGFVSVKYVKGKAILVTGHGGP
jgi:hypothetical protein